MNKPKIYLAGPIDGLGYSEAVDWRDYATFTLHPDITCFSPMRAKEYLKNESSIVGQYQYPLSTPRAIMTRDFYDCTNCDMVLVNLSGATRASLGTTMEIAWAYQARIPVVLVMEKTGNIHEHAMITEAIGFRTDSLEEACNIVKAVLLPGPIAFGDKTYVRP